MRSEKEIRKAAADSIKAYIMARGYNGKDLAAMVYRTPPSVYRWLNGEANVGIVELTLIADIVGVGIEELIGGGTMLHYMGFDIAQLKDGWVYIFNRGAKVYAEKFDKRLTIDERKAVVDEFLKSKGEQKC